jgi:hypothetical protein
MKYKIGEEKLSETINLPKEIDLTKDLPGDSPLKTTTKNDLLEELNKDENKVRLYLAYSSIFIFMMAFAACLTLSEELVMGVIAPMVCFLGMIISFYFRKK